MPHGIESMFYAGHRPWHGLGVSVEMEVTSGDAIRHAGLDWDVEAVPLYAEHPASSPAAALVQAVPDHRAIMRLTDQKVLGVVGSRYHCIQNREAFQFCDELVGRGQAIYHTAGSLDGGRRIWLLALLPGRIVVGPGDVTEKYMLLYSTHDGSSALRMLPTPIRVCCSNTLQLALDDGAGEGITIRHTATAPARMEQAMRTLRVANRHFNEFEVEATRLASTRFTDLQMLALATALFPDRDGEPSPRGRNARGKLIELFTEGMGHAPIRGTAWAALNSVAEYTDHHRVVRTKPEISRAEARLSAAWFGTGAALKRQAYEVINQQLAA